MRTRKPGTLVASPWLLCRGDSVVPIPGTGKLHRLQENLSSTDLTLSDDDLRRCDGPPPGSASPAREVAAMSSTAEA